NKSKGFEKKDQQRYVPVERDRNRDSEFESRSKSENKSYQREYEKPKVEPHSNQERDRTFDNPDRTVDTRDRSFERDQHSNQEKMKIERDHESFDRQRNDSGNGWKEQERRNDAPVIQQDRRQNEDSRSNSSEEKGKQKEKDSNKKHPS